MKTKILSCLAMVAFLALPLFGADSPVLAQPLTTPGPVAPAPIAPAPTPASLSPGVAEVIKLSGAGVGDDVVLAYIKNCQSPFTLSATGILRLKEAGVTSPVITAMLTHDSVLASQNPPAPPGYTQRLYTPGADSAIAPSPAPAQPAPQPQVVAQATAPLVPPAAPAEVVTVAPGPDYYWAPGYWGWSGGWIWIGGGWCYRGGYGHYGGWYGHGGWGGYHGGGGVYHGGGGGHGGGGHGH